MARRKRPNMADAIYSNHLFGSEFKQNPNSTRFSLIESMYQRILTELASNRFKWTGLPDEVDVRYLELNLFYHALSVFFYNKDFDKYMALKGGGTNWINMMDNPTSFMVIGNNFVSKTLSAKDCVPIWANQLRRPDVDIITLYAHKLAELDVTIEINSKNARQNKVLVTNENQRLSVTNINRQIDNGENGITVAGPIQDMQFVQALDLGINPDSLEKLDVLRARQWNVAMSLLGIENANQDKTERLVSGEVDANNGQTASMRFVNLNERRRAAKLINEKYGLNVSVEFFTEADRLEKIAAQQKADKVDPTVHEAVTDKDDE